MSTRRAVVFVVALMSVGVGASRAEAQPCTASFSQVVMSPAASVSFTDLGTDPSATLVSWSWTFGDGSSSTLQNPTHTYSGGGGYSPCLMVTNDVGRS